jgi:predicted Zn-dependent protease
MHENAMEASMTPQAGYARTAAIAVVLAVAAAFSVPASAPRTDVAHADVLATHIERPCDPVVTAEPTGSLCGPLGRCACIPGLPIPS